MTQGTWSEKVLLKHFRTARVNKRSQGITMPSITKPAATHPSLQRNSLGLTIRDYEGAMSTLCAGCGHDSVTAAIVRALWETATEPRSVAKMSGIGCSSKTPAYFVPASHAFNS